MTGQSYQLGGVGVLGLVLLALLVLSQAVAGAALPAAAPGVGAGELVAPAGLQALGRQISCFPSPVVPSLLQFHLPL